MSRTCRGRPGLEQALPSGPSPLACPQLQPRRRGEARPDLEVHCARIGGADALDDARDLRLDLARLLDVDLVARADADLQQHVPVPVVRVVAQQRLPREHLGRDSLEPIEVVHAAHNHAAGGADLFTDGGVKRRRSQPHGPRS